MPFLKDVHVTLTESEDICDWKSLSGSFNPTLYLALQGHHYTMALSTRSTRHLNTSRDGSSTCPEKTVPTFDIPFSEEIFPTTHPY